MNINECGCRPYGWLGLDGDRCIRVIPRQSSHALYKEHQEREKEDEERRKGILEEKGKERQKMVQKKESLQRSANSIKEEEMNAIEKLDTVDELVKDAEKKLKTALARSSMSRSLIDAANMMLQKGN